jgi:hypothetical protein
MGGRRAHYCRDVASALRADFAINVRAAEPPSWLVDAIAEALR